MEDRRERERKGKRKKAKKPTGRIPGRSTDEREQIKYFGKLDILLGRRKVGFFDKIEIVHNTRCSGPVQACVESIINMLSM